VIRSEKLTELSYSWISAKSIYVERTDLLTEVESFVFKWGRKSFAESIKSPNSVFKMLVS